MNLRVLPPLSEKQEVVFRYLWAYFQEHRFFPKHREIMAYLNLKGVTAAGYLNPLENKGYIARDGRHGRNMQITEMGYEKLRLMGVIEEGQQPGLFG